MGLCAQKAKNLFLNGYNCSQSVLLAFSDLTGLDDETAFKIASSFGGGMGRLREVCGAVSGMFMVAGLLFSKTSLTTNEDKIKHYALIQELAKEFKDKNGSLICRELLSGSFKNVDESPCAGERTAEYYKKRPCADFVYECAEIIENRLQNK
jgi:C_GCAxxG_C_C family probable redox protein